MAVIASNYVRNMLEDARRGFYGRLKQGLYPLSAPMGYLNMGSGKPKAFDPVKAPLVKEMFELYCYENYSVDNLRKEMHKRGLGSGKSNKVYSVNAIHSALRNTFYMGLITLQSTGETFVGKHQPLISKDLFEKVQDKLQGKKIRGKSKHDYMFRKLIKCHCGYTLVGGKHKGRVYYECHRKGCRSPSLREDYILDTILKKIRSINLSKIQKEELKKFLNDSAENTHKTKKEQIKIFELRLSNLRIRAKKLLDKYLDGLIDDDLYQSKNREIVSEELEITEKLTNFKYNNDGFQIKAKDFIELAESLYFQYLLADKQKKALIAKNLFLNLTSKDGKLIISTNFPYYLFEDNEVIPYCGHY